MTIILFENPPYRDDTTGNSEGTMTRSYADSYVKKQMKVDLKNGGAVVNDIANRFIWSAFKYYLRQPTDSYVIYSPVKYFKSCGLANKQFNNGYLLNRQHFHAGASAVSLMWWQNIDEDKQEYKLDAMNIKLKEEQDLDIQEQTNQGEIVKESEINVKKVYKVMSELKDKRKFEDDIDGIICDTTGYEIPRKNKMNFTPIYNKNIIGYLIADRFTINHQSMGQITSLGQDAHAGAYIRKDNFIEKLPMFWPNFIHRRIGMSEMFISRQQTEGKII